MTADALAGVRVLNLAESLAAAWCARLLGDLGAEATIVEPPGGAALRRVAPFDAEGVSIPARYALGNQRSAMLDLARDADRATLRALAARAEVVIAGRDGAPLAAAGIERESQRAVVVSVTPHGVAGPRAHLPGNDLTAFAQSGWAAVNGPPGQPPLKGPGYAGSLMAGAAAAGAALAALLVRERHGRGQHVDVAETDVLATMFGPVVLNALYSGQRRGRHVMWWENPIGGPAPVRDGYFMLQLGRAYFWRDAMHALGLPEYATDERYLDAQWRTQHAPDFRQRVLEAMAPHGKHELFELLSTLRVIAGPVLDMAEIAEDPHLRARGAFVQPECSPEHPPIAGPPFCMSATPPRVRHAAPGVGEHTAAVRAEAAGVEPASAAPAGARDARMPLAGLRVLALTQVWAGAACAQLLGMLGAEVIKVEARRKPDVWRGGGGYDFAIPAACASVPPRATAGTATPRSTRATSSSSASRSTCSAPRASRCCGGSSRTATWCSRTSRRACCPTSGSGSPHCAHCGQT